MGMGAYSAAVYEKTSLPARVREVARPPWLDATDCGGERLPGVCLNSRSPQATADGFDEHLVDAVVSCSTGASTAWASSTIGSGWLARCSPTASPPTITALTMASSWPRCGHTAWASTDIEIIELAALCAMTIGNGRFLTVLGVAADDDGHYLIAEGDG